MSAALERRPGAHALGAGLFDEALIQVENMLALGPFPRFAESTVKNVENSWRMVVAGFSFEEAGGVAEGTGQDGTLPRPYYQQPTTAAESITGSEFLFGIWQI